MDEASWAASGVICPTGVSVKGEPETASLTSPCLLNLALEDAKSKSDAGTSTFVGRGPRLRIALLLPRLGG